MAAYDPKRPRPVVDRDAPAPVEALIEPPAPAPAPEPVVVPAAEPVVVPEPVTELRAPARQDGGSPGSDVPVAAAPEADTANRAVMLVMVSAAVAGVIALLLLLRRRR